jgi:hypothetical protein
MIRVQRMRGCSEGTPGGPTNAVPFATMATMRGFDPHPAGPFGVRAVECDEATFMKPTQYLSETAAIPHPRQCEGRPRPELSRDARVEPAARIAPATARCATANGAHIGLLRAVARDLLGHELEMDEAGRRGEPWSDPGGQGV